MSERTPKHGLTRTKRGWIKRINKAPKWICSDRIAPSAAAADDYYEKQFTQLWQPPPAVIEADDPQDALVADLMDLFLTRKLSRVGLDRRGISRETYNEYEAALQAFCDHLYAPAKGEERVPLGQLRYRQLTRDHFASFDASLSKRYGILRQMKWLVTVRSAFKMLAQPPTRLPLPDYGDQFSLPTKRERRLAKAKHRHKHGPKLFEPDEAKALLIGRLRTPDEMAVQAARRAGGPHKGLPRKIRRRIRGAGPALRAMILLALNAGFGNTDVGELTIPIIMRALRTEWIDYERGKTGARRLAWLWPETRSALRRYIRHWRPLPAAPEFADVLFLTEYGNPYITETKDQVAIRSDAVIRRLGLLRLGRNFYSLRRTYRSIAAEIGKELVIDLSMGHAEDGEDMAKVYTVAELRVELKKIALHVRSVVLTAPPLQLAGIDPLKLTA